MRVLGRCSRWRKYFVIHYYFGVSAGYLAKAAHEVKNTQTSAIYSRQSSLTIHIMPSRITMPQGDSITTRLSPGKSRHMNAPRSELSRVPEDLRAATRKIPSATALIHALALARDHSQCRAQLELLAQHAHQHIVQLVHQLTPATNRLEARGKLALTEATLPALRRLLPQQYNEFRTNIRRTMAHDARIDLYEFALTKITLHQLDIHFGLAKEKRLPPGGLTGACRVVLSCLAHVSSGKPGHARAAFNSALPHLQRQPRPNTLLPFTECNLPQVDKALSHLQHGSCSFQSKFIAACAHLVSHDQLIRDTEHQLLRAIAATLGRTLPPLIE